MVISMNEKTSYEIWREMIDTIVKALEEEIYQEASAELAKTRYKQDNYRDIKIPKKPKGDYDSVPHHRCPNCNGAIRVYCDDPYDPVCKFCGQRLLWDGDTE